MFAFDPAKAVPDPVAEILLRHFPMVTRYLDSFDEELHGHSVAFAIARWFSEDPHGADRMIPVRIEDLYADPMVQRDLAAPWGMFPL